MDALEEKKAEARARIEAAAKRREERKAAAQADAELASLEREAALAEALEAAEEKHGPLGRKLLVVHAKQPDGNVIGSAIVRVASSSDFSKFKNKLATAKGIEIDHAQEALWRPCVVYPTLPEVDRLCTELPFFSTALADAVGRLCGVRSEDLAGK